MNAVTKALLFATAAFLLAGLVIGFGTPLGNDCGAAFLAGEASFETEAVCENVRGQARGLPVMLLVFASVSAAAALVYGNPSQTKRT